MWRVGEEGDSAASKLLLLSPSFFCFVFRSLSDGVAKSDSAQSTRNSDKEKKKRGRGKKNAVVGRTYQSDVEGSRYTRRCTYPDGMASCPVANAAMPT